VTDSTILGGRTMRAYVADWSRLGSGERPWTAGLGREVDALDVADLESEAAHDYELLGAHEHEQTVRDSQAPDGAGVIDGGRTHRRIERFVAQLPAGAPARCVVRLAGDDGTRVRVLANGTPVGLFDTTSEEDWVERPFDVPASVAAARTLIELRATGGDVETYHYWCTATAG
jgi:hypothetical protein